MIVKIIKLGRLHFVAGGLMLFCLGALFAIIVGAEFSLTRFLFGYAILFCAHLSVSYSNDYFDRDSDRYNNKTMFSGGSGILVSSPELREFAKRFAIVLIIISISLACIFTFVYAFPWYFLGFVIFGNLLGWFYTAPPIGLVDRKMGELATVLTTGIMLPGMGYLVTYGSLNWQFLVIAIPLMIYGAAFILGVEIPDMEGDKKVNKRTLIVRRGRGFGFTIIGLCFLAATIYFALIAVFFSSITALRFEWFAVLSAIPASLGLVGLLIRPSENIAASKLANNEVAALFMFVLFVDIYLFVDLI